jgi:DNA-binding response OmpR family regulator
VDDEKELAVTLAERLTIRGFSVDWAITAESALKLFRDNKYDIAVLDVKLPGLSGVTLKEHMAEIEPRLKFIFMTGHGSQEDFEAGSASAGESNYLWKPVDIEALTKKIHLLVKEVD